MKGEVEVTVKYRFGKTPPPPPHPPATSEVEIEIYIEKAETGWIFVPAYAALPCGVHRVYWIPRGPGSPVIEGLWINQKPPRVLELESPNQGNESGKWTAVYNNPGVEGVNAILYTFSGRNNAGAFGPPNFEHDPTIAVTNDPPPGLGYRS